MTHAYQTTCIRCNHTDDLVTTSPMRRNQATGPCTGDECTGMMYIKARRCTQARTVVIA